MKMKWTTKITDKKAQIQNLKNQVRNYVYNAAQYELFAASEPEFSDPVDYWGTILRALCYAQGTLEAMDARSLDDRLEVDNPELTVVNLVASHLAMTVQRKAYPLKNGELVWESGTAWVHRVIYGLQAEAVLTYWHKSEVESLFDALLERADLARFVGAVNAALGQEIGT